MVFDMTPNRRNAAQNTLRRSSRQAHARREQHDTALRPTVDESGDQEQQAPSSDAGLIADAFEQDDDQQVDGNTYSPAFSAASIEHKDRVKGAGKAVAAPEAKHDSTPPLPADLESVNIHTANLARFNDEELLRIWAEQPACLQYNLSGLRIVERPKKSTKNPVKSIHPTIVHFQTDILGSFHINGDLAVRGTVGRPTLSYASGLKLLWQVGCFNAEGRSPSTSQDVIKTAVRESYGLDPSSPNSKLTVGSAANSVSKRISTSLRAWFGCTEQSDLPVEVRKLRKTLPSDFAGVLRPFCKPNSLEAIDYDQAQRVAGYRSADEMDTVPASYEQGFQFGQPQAGSAVDEEGDDPVAAYNDAVRSFMLQKKRCSSSAVRGKKRPFAAGGDGAAPPLKRQRRSNLPSTHSGRDGGVSSGLRPLLPQPGPQLPHELPNDAEASYGVSYGAANVQASYANYDSSGYQAAHNDMTEPVFTGFDAAEASATVASLQYAFDPPHQALQGTHDTMNMYFGPGVTDQFSEEEIWFQQSLMQQLGPVHDENGQALTDCTTNFTRYAMRFFEQSFRKGLI